MRTMYTYVYICFQTWTFGPLSGKIDPFFAVTSVITEGTSLSEESKYLRSLSVISLTPLLVDIFPDKMQQNFVL